MSETALTAASRGKLHQVLKKGNVKASTAINMQNNISHVIGSILIGNTITTVLLTSVTTWLLLEVLGDMGLAYASVVISILIVVYGEFMPKIFAVNQPEDVCIMVAPWINRFVRLIGPITKLIDFCVKMNLGILGIKKVQNTKSSHEELLGAIEMHGKDPNKGKEVIEEKAMLKSILDLVSVDVSMIMTHRKNVVAIDADSHNSLIIKQILNSPFSRMPIWHLDPDNIIGVVHHKTALRAFNSDIAFDIRSIALKPWFILDSTNLYDQLQAFREQREHFAIVVDEYGTVMGIVTLEDILEEIVGEIIDECDVSSLGIRPQSDGSFIVDGSMPIRDLNRKFDWDIPEGIAATIAGLLLYETRQIPEQGQIFVLYSFRFEIMKRQKNHISLIKISKF